MGKVRVIDTIYISGLPEVKIIYDVDRMKFKARVFEEWLFGDTLLEIRESIKLKIEGVINSKYDWIPIIELEERYSYGNHNLECIAGFVADRYYVAQRENGEWIRCDWKLDLTKRAEACQSFRKKGFSVPSVERDEYHSDSATFFILYTEQCWKALQYIGGVMDSLQEKIRELLGTEEGNRKLSSSGGRLMIDFKGDKDAGPGAGSSDQI